MEKFSHLHVHTQFSLLDGAASIKNLYKKALNDNMPAIAITDHGNMFGVFNFVAEAWNHKTDDGKPKVKPIVGCEFYLVQDRHRKSFTKMDKDVRYHQLLLAKDEEGYKNLCKLSSLGYIEGLYGKYPRIDKELILRYHKGLIATTCCLGAEVPKTILRYGEEEGEKVFKWWLDLFGEDYYIELQRHKIPEQEKVNQTLLKFAAKYNVKIIASNDSHYVDREDAQAHDILLCVNTGSTKSMPTYKDFGDEETIPKGTRFAFYNDEFYFKNTQEMNKLFEDLPQAIDNTNEIVDKVTTLNLRKDILLPNFPVPPEFNSQHEFLRHLTFEGAKMRYSEITPEIEERLNFELRTIEVMGFSGYFLIVMDFIQAGKELGVLIGPGRGSAAGSAVAYCIGITNIDPIKYNLLFERFLNPDRKSMPDIDTDFDDEGRQKVIEYTVQKYGKNQVAQIITYGTMAAKMSIKDVARVMDLDLQTANYLAKLVPDKPGISLGRILTAPIDGEKSLKEKEDLQPEDIENVKLLREKLNSGGLESLVLQEAMKLEGSVRNTGIHAAGIIIAPSDLTDLIPVATVKDSDLLVSQYEGKVIEDAGVIKMDFLGLKTLTIIRDALQLIKKNHGIEINIQEVPLDDAKTFELYQKGMTNATFQFESAGMRKHLIDLKPDKFEDLIAMNALYRPGPLEYIPTFIRRKHGKEPIVYDLPELEEHLAETYGITVYQEQVMLLSQKLANFTKGDADTLRKAMGKKQIEVLNKMKDKFMKGCEANGLDLKICDKIWKDWEAFASYAFNKSHSTCYAFLAFQTAYLKAHYPAEYMAAVMTNNLGNLEKLTFFMEECKKNNIPVLGPDINESDLKFTVNKKGEIRFALAAIKGVGEGAVQAILDEREANGPYTSVGDMMKRNNAKSINKRVLESLALAGAFDCFENIHRAQYVESETEDGPIYIEKLIKFGQSYQANKDSAQVSLFGDIEEEVIVEPEPPVIPKWSNLYQLSKEKEVVGIYLSGHPLDEFKFELKYYFKTKLEEMQDSSNLRKMMISGSTFTVGGFIKNVDNRLTKDGRPYARIILEDYTGEYEFSFFKDDYVRFSPFLIKDSFITISFIVEDASRWKGEGEVSIKIKNVDALKNIKSQVKKTLLVKVNAKYVTEENLQKLLLVLEKHKGKSKMILGFIDPAEKISVATKALGIGVNISEELIEDLELIPNIDYGLN